MPITYQQQTAVFEGTCSLEETEKLLEWLEANPKGNLNLKKCEHFHSAILQVLLVFRPRISELPDDPYICEWVVPSILSKN